MDQKSATRFVFELWDNIADFLGRDDLTRLALLSDFHLQIARMHLYTHLVLRNERQANPPALETIYLILRNPLLQRRIRSLTILTPALGMGVPTTHKNWVERYGVQLLTGLTELRVLNLKRPPCARVKLMERFLGVVSKSCRKLTHLTMEGPSSLQYRSVGSKYTFSTPLYQIPSLRSMVITGKNTNLPWNIGSGVLLHPISNLTSLHIEITLPNQRWLADPAHFADIWSLRFPYLTHLTVGDMPQGAHSATLSIFLNRHPTITHLTLSAKDADRTFSITPEPDALPALKHLSVTPHMLHWLQVNVTLLSLRTIQSLVLDCSYITAASFNSASAALSSASFAPTTNSGPGPIIAPTTPTTTTQNTVFHHFPAYPQFLHLKHFTLLGISHVSITKALILTFRNLAPRLEHWTGGFYHRHSLGDMLELSSSLSLLPSLRRLDICQWIGAEHGVAARDINAFGAIWSGLTALEKVTVFGCRTNVDGMIAVNGGYGRDSEGKGVRTSGSGSEGKAEGNNADGNFGSGVGGSGNGCGSVIGVGLGMKVYEVVQEFRMRDVPDSGVSSFQLGRERDSSSSTLQSGGRDSSTFQSGRGDNSSSSTFQFGRSRDSSSSRSTFQLWGRDRASSSSTVQSGVTERGDTSFDSGIGMMGIDKKHAGTGMGMGTGTGMENVNMGATPTRERRLVETYSLRDSMSGRGRYGYQGRRVLDFASVEWEWDEGIDVY